ncbi:uncharacterized protein LOC122069772 [Macadamia integrifolia]|uniref:uncharacterized protein LOC122069772 n=1 Tax=Macadamia integrifolia TaxID=60698 RepID=UPI001C4EEC14|nr:uncharacterized protein LOC122069772 [Macadamia integrifolia]
MDLKQQKLKEFWDKWELEISILLSLFLQIILILTANLRKRRSTKWVAFVLWMAYLAADWVATFSLGIISSTLNNPGQHWYDFNMLAFWTPFLLLHLGGPDTITAFSLEDSQLWLRHLLSLIFQFIAVSYIFFRSLKPQNKLFVPTIFVLTAGVLKYGERTWSLKQASMGGLRISLIKKRDAGPDYAAVMEDFSSDLRAGNPGMLTVRRENQKKPEYFKFMEEGLSNNSISIDRKDQQKLLYGAFLFFETFKRLFVDLILTFQDRKYSVDIFDWTVVSLRKAKWSPEWLERGVFKIISTFRYCSKFRWSNQMGQYSLLSYIVHQPKHLKLGKTLDLLGLKEMWDEYWYIKYKKVRDDLKNHIFEHLKRKSKDEQDKRLNTREGQWEMKLPKDCLPQWITTETEFDESLVMWHLATEICYKLQKNKVYSSAKEEDFSKENKTWFCDFFRKKKKEKQEFPKHCLASKDISRYLLYLLLSRPTTMSSIAGLAVIRHGDTCEEAQNFFFRERMAKDKFMSGCAIDKSEAIKSLMIVHTYVRAQEVKGDQSKSILWDAVELARKLQELDEAKRWEIANTVWIEMLCYAARHCRGNYHAQTLAAGGELLTFVWLMEAHFGMGGHYQIKSGEFSTSYTAEN